ncbi:AraC family transcriptional regulator [Aequorivita sp. H23M31]|uniref:AraC family transcriptional regulator n=1 Tax=Aequorivita ciconiae TaxID=2494375 RepID=A0A410G449_9FLAO|nr:response regulator transcription factor [Aequorivita sp. H23M31]QAA82036.1 AraC family transcriptional regulator [Aequorivita sp. H23M31]
MPFRNPPFQIYTNTEIGKNLINDENFKVLPPFFLLVNKGKIDMIDGDALKVGEKTISVFAKENKVIINSISEDCAFILLQYKREYIKSMTLKLDLLDAFKYVYSSPQLTFELSKENFSDLWVLAEYIKRQQDISLNSEIEQHLLRHLNYSFLYSSVHKMNQTKSFEASPRNQQQNIVLGFLKNLQRQGSTKLNVSDYAKMQHITTRHLSATVKQITGMSALDIIHRMVVHRAKNELTETNKPISEIAFQLGYTDPFTFSHFFKKKTGFNPTEFRAKYQG